MHSILYSWKRTPEKRRRLRYLAVFLELSAIAIVAYLLVLPLYPKFIYKKDYRELAGLPESAEREVIRVQVAEFKAGLPENEYDTSPNRLIIPKIGVNAPIIDSKSEAYGLSQGAWRLPDSAKPGERGNSVITAHRFKYLPPHNLTFYLIDKLKAGDLISVTYNDQDYTYKVRGTKVVDDEDFSILNGTDTAVLTLFSCHPVYSTEKRFVVVADLEEEGAGQ
jgi:LPXTG-site transpeptidase (sortase) family protein